MKSLRQFPLGASFPESPHAVTSSLPTLEDVRGYEEKQPRVMEALRVGYPRFITHPYVLRLTEEFLKSAGLEGRAGVLVRGQRASVDLREWLNAPSDAMEVREALFLVHVDADNREVRERARQYLQHTGCGVGSRQAEDLLLEMGLLESSYPEEAVAENASREVASEVARLCGVQEKDVRLCASGMNAVYAAFQGVRDRQRRRGRGQWIQLGWLYLDTGCILREFLGENEQLHACYDAMDTDTVIRRIRECGSQLAGLVVECPTNPVVQVSELGRISEVVREAGGVLIADPTIASIYNIKLIPEADLLVSSLTKYAAHEGDVMAGTMVLNPESPYYGDLAANIPEFNVPPYERDCRRLAWEMRSAPEVVAAMNRNARQLVEHLRRHPGIQRIYTALDADAFSGLAQAPDCPGAVFSVELKGSAERFYDAATVMKGPSFGTWFTLFTPFLYLAHYDLVSNKRGRGFLRELGMDPELIRISVGTEPYADIKAVVDAALEESVAPRP
ncbi:MAG: PLP-dependent transferase [Opitutales bacterium]